MAAGYQAQLKSIVMLKNKAGVLPLQTGKTVYVPKKFTPAGKNFLGMPYPEKTEYPVNMETVKKYFKVTENPMRPIMRWYLLPALLATAVTMPMMLKQAATAICRYHYSMANTLPKLPAKPALPVAIRWRNSLTAATKENRKHQPTLPTWPW
jgi:hypothetical protein